MARLRSNNVFGTTTDNPLTAGATTLNSAGLANLVAVTGSDTAVITLDPNRVNGAPEIVTVTAHTGSATSATITRGAEGTSAREHPAGTFWVHAPTTTDWGTDWKAWTPTWTNLTVGSGTVVARYVQVGKTVHYYLQFTFGAGSSVGDTIFSLPVTAASTVATTSIIGMAHISDTGTINLRGFAWLNSSTTGRLFAELASGTYVGLAVLSSTVPMTWANTDFFIITGSYEAA